MQKHSLILIAVILPLLAAAQSANNFDKVWIQGGPIQYKTTFSPTGTSNVHADTSHRYYLFDGHSNICDSFGNLLLCSDGYNIYNSSLTSLEGGDSLVPNEIIEIEQGWSSYSQSSIFLPFKDGKYYFITPTASDNEINTYWKVPSSGRALFDLLLYHVIDMKANNGAGKVMRRSVPLLQNVKLSKSQMMACKQGDGMDWWLLKQAHDTNMIYKFLFKQDTILGPFIQGFQEPHFTKFDQSGQSAFSRDGTKYATTCRGARKVFVADFDRCTGLLSNPHTYEVPLQNNDLTNGLAFSPNGRFIYVNGFGNVQQMDLQATNPNNSWVFVAGIDTTFNFQEYSCLYLGPDDKLYIGNWNGLGNTMSVINNPDNKGVACNFCPRCLRFPSFSYRNITYNIGVASPPCMPNYHLGAMNPICWPTIVPKLKNEFILSVFPNPASTVINFGYSKAGIVQLSDPAGRVIRSFSLPDNYFTHQVDIANIPAGIYIYRYFVDGVVCSIGKVLIR